MIRWCRPGGNTDLTLGVHCAGPGSDPLPLPLPFPLPEVPRTWPAERTHGDALRCEAQEGTAIQRPNAAASVLQALQPVAEKRVEMQQRALAGQATAVVQMDCELADALRSAGRRAIELLLAQAAPAEPTGGACACGGPTHSEGFEPQSFVIVSGAGA
jgi:hypothetical protein